MTYKLKILPLSLAVLLLIVFVSGAFNLNIFAQEDSSRVTLEVIGTLEETAIDAIDDSATTNQNEPVDIAVLDNDTVTNSEFDLSTLEIVDNPSNGNIEIIGNETRYTPNQEFDGEDQLRYRICNLARECDEADVFITVIRIREPEQPAPQPQPEPKPLLPIPLPITGGQMIAAGSVMSSLAFLIFGVWLFFFRRKEKYQKIDHKKDWDERR